MGKLFFSGRKRQAKKMMDEDEVSNISSKQSTYHEF